MAGWRDPPPHTAAPPDGGYRGALARHVRHVRPVGDGGVFLLFHDELGRVISSTSTSSQVTRMEPQPEPASFTRPLARRPPFSMGMTACPTLVARLLA